MPDFTKKRPCIKFGSYYTNTQLERWFVFNTKERTYEYFKGNTETELPSEKTMSLANCVAEIQTLVSSTAEL